MSKTNKPVSLARETSIIVFSGLAINYPLSILVSWILISVLEISSAFIFATLQTVIFTIVSWTRIYFIRKKMQKRVDISN